MSSFMNVFKGKRGNLKLYAVRSYRLTMIIRTSYEEDAIVVQAIGHGGFRSAPRIFKWYYRFPQVKQYMSIEQQTVRFTGRPA